MEKAGSTDDAPVLKNLRTTKGYLGQTGAATMVAKTGVFVVKAGSR